MPFFPATHKRVPEHTSLTSNLRISDSAMKRLERIGYDPVKINQRLAELEQEWDIERILEAHAAAVSLAGISLGVAKHKGFFLIPALVAGFLFQHATQGWCPPLPILRGLGFRTAHEIETERMVLKLRRGDLKGIETAGTEEAYRTVAG